MVPERTKWSEDKERPLTKCRRNPCRRQMQKEWEYIWPFLFAFGRPRRREIESFAKLFQKRNITNQVTYPTPLACSFHKNTQKYTVKLFKYIYISIYTKYQIILYLCVFFYTRAPPLGACVVAKTKLCKLCKNTHNFPMKM